MCTRRQCLKCLGRDYAEMLMDDYVNLAAVPQIEAWRTRLPTSADIAAVIQVFPYLNRRQAKKVNEYAKGDIMFMISRYLANIEC